MPTTSSAGRSSITITRVTVGKKTDDQPVVIYYEGDGGRPYKPSKGMRRVLIHIWGPKSAEYVGRQLGLYRDGKVKFGADEVGGIRIGAASHVAEQQRVMIQVKKGQKAGHVVKVLQQDRQRSAEQPREHRPPEQPQQRDDAPQTQGGDYDGV